MTHDGAGRMPMPERGDRAHLHDESMRARFAIAKGLSAMAAEEREMECAMKAFEEDADQAKRHIAAEWRREHWGLEPERPPAWGHVQAASLKGRLTREGGMATVTLEDGRQDLVACVPTFEHRAHRAKEAAAAAQRRAAAARVRKQAAARRVAELRGDRAHPVRRTEEAVIRVARAEITAQDAHRLAAEEYEHAAVAHEEAGRAHERAAELIERRGDRERAAWHRDAAARACTAAAEDRRSALGG